MANLGAFIRKSQWLNGDSAREYEGQTFRISGVTTQEFKHGSKVCVAFKELDKSLPLNQSSFDRLAKSFGLESGDWVGQRVGWTVVPIQIDGQSKWSVSVRPMEDNPGADPPF